MLNNSDPNDDDDFFAPVTSSSSSNLASLFSGDGQELRGSLTYTPLKQPKPSSIYPQPQQPVQKKLICMKTITLSKVNEGNYLNLGKHGMAIIADTLSSDLIIYKTRQNILSSTKLTSKFHWINDNELVVTFTDDQQKYWMITFDNLKDKMEIVDELNKHGTSIDSLQLKSDSHKSSVNDYSQKLVAEKPEEEIKTQEGDKVKADILGRISKMGLSILPTAEPSSLTPSASSTNKFNKLDKELSESEPEEVIRTTKPRKIRTRHSESSIEIMDIIKPSSATPVKTYNSMTHHHNLIDPLGIYFAENRTHNSEVRMNLAQLSNKIDLLLGEVRPHNDRDFLERRISELEQRLNKSLETSTNSDNFALERKCEELKKENAQNILKYDEIITKLRLEVETLNSNLKEVKESSSQKIALIEGKNTDLIDTNAQLGEKLKALDKVVISQKTQIQELESKNQNLDGQTELLTKCTNEVKETQEYNRRLQQEIDAMAEKYKILESKYEQKCQVEAEVDEHFTELTKQSMNEMYLHVLNDYGLPPESQQGRELKKVLQKYLKNTTFTIIEHYRTRQQRITNTNLVTPVSPEFEVTV